MFNLIEKRVQDYNVFAQLTTTYHIVTGIDISLFASLYTFDLVM